MSLNAGPVTECLIRCDLNKMLSIKIFFGREEFKELDIEAVPER